MAVTTTSTAGAQPLQAGRRPLVSRSQLAWTGTLPFLGYVGVFLLLPTGIVLWDAVHSSSGGFDFGAIGTLWSSSTGSFFVNSAELSAITSVIGALLGALLAYAVATGNPDGLVRRLYLAGLPGCSPSSAG